MILLIFTTYVQDSKYYKNDPDVIKHYMELPHHDQSRYLLCFCDYLKHANMFVADLMLMFTFIGTEA